MATNQEKIDQAKSEFARARQRITSALATTPDDRLNWSPSASARTPLETVAHVAQSVKSLHETYEGHPFDIPNTAEADRMFRAAEKPYTTREQALELLNTNCDAYEAWLEKLAPEQIDAIIALPFGFGSAPLFVAIPFQAGHMLSHASQIDYIQTIYGDREWHR